MRLLTRPDWQRQGEDPDYRFSLANERTFLAWIRTALAMLAGAIVLHQLGAGMHPRWLLAVAVTSIACVAVVLGAAAYRRWRDNEIAMRHSRPLPAFALMPFLSGTVVALGLGTVLYFVLA